MQSLLCAARSPFSTAQRPLVLNFNVCNLLQRPLRKPQSRFSKKLSMLQVTQWLPVGAQSHLRVPQLALCLSQRLLCLLLDSPEKPLSAFAIGLSYSMNN